MLRAHFCMTRYLVTGAAGFIGSHVASRLLDRGDEVLGLDNVNDYYDVRLKEARLARLEGRPGFRFVRGDIADREAMAALFARERFPVVVHLAAQAGVRYSIENPHAYVDSNLVGFVNVLEGCRHNGVGHLVYASSSSVYGANTSLPFRVGDPVDRPVSLYAATKRANELMAYTYAHLYALPSTGLRFFTVYGPWGRPDMAPILFTRAILAGEPIKVFNHGAMRRDFTYVDDIVEAVVRVSDRPPAVTPGGPSAPPQRVYNVGNNQSVALTDFIASIEKALGVTAQRTLLPMQPGDVHETYADVEDLTRDVGFSPSTPLDEGVARFVAWYRGFYGPAV